MKKIDEKYEEVDILPITHRKSPIRIVQAKSMNLCMENKKLKRIVGDNNKQIQGKNIQLKQLEDQFTETRKIAIRVLPVSSNVQVS